MDSVDSVDSCVWIVLTIKMDVSPVIKNDVWLETLTQMSPGPQWNNEHL